LANRVSQSGREPVGAGPLSHGRVSQFGREYLYVEDRSKARISQSGREPVQAGPVSEMRVTQFGREVIRKDGQMGSADYGRMAALITQGGRFGW
jgi:hypothetical protein